MKKLLIAGLLCLLALSGCAKSEATEPVIKAEENKETTEIQEIETEEEILPPFDPIAFMSQYEAFLSHLTEIGQREGFDTLTNELTSEQVALVKTETSDFVTEEFFNNQLKDVLNTYYSGLDAVGSWKHIESQQDVFGSFIDILEPTSTGFDFVMDAYYKQNIGEMSGHAVFTSDEKIKAECLYILLFCVFQIKYSKNGDDEHHNADNRQ